MISLVCFLWLSPAHAQERILALAPHVCETLYAIGAGKDIVGTVSYCDFPEEVALLPQVGAYNRINIEAAIALKPTVAIVMSNQLPGIQKLKALGVKVVESNPVRVEAVFADIVHMGQVTGYETNARFLVQSLQLRLDKILSIEQRPVFYEIWPDPLLTAGQNTFIHDVLKKVGLRNVFGSLNQEAPRVNLESVLAAKPQLVIVPSEKRDVTQRTKFWKTWLGEEIKVITVNPDLVHRPGPRLLDGMEDLVAQIRGLNI